MGIDEIKDAAGRKQRCDRLGPADDVGEPSDCTPGREHDVEFAFNRLLRVVNIGANKIGCNTDLRRQTLCLAIAAGEKSSPVATAPSRARISVSSPKWHADGSAAYQKSRRVRRYRSHAAASRRREIARLRKIRSYRGGGSPPSHPNCAGSRRRIRHGSSIGSEKRDA